MNASSNGGCCTSLAEGCDGNGIFYGEYIAPKEEVFNDEPMWIGRKENYRPPRPVEEDEPVEDEPMWIGRKESYRPPRPEEEEVFDGEPMWIGRKESYRPPRPLPKEEEESGFKGPRPHPRGRDWRNGNRTHPPLPFYGRKVHRFVREHKQQLAIAAILLVAVYLYRRSYMTPAAPKEEEKKCTCTCGKQQPVVSQQVSTGAYALWNPPQQPLVEKQPVQLV
jgi:hypothetical protein